VGSTLLLVPSLETGEGVDSVVLMYVCVQIN